MKVGYIGVGNMGGPMCRNLIKKSNHQVTVFDLNEAAVKTCTDLGATGAKSVAEVTRGADVVMTTSALLKHGAGYMKVLRDGLVSWLAARDLTTLDSVRGRMSQRNIDDKTAFARANYITVLQGY